MNKTDEIQHLGKLEVLDKGYVILQDKMGSDLTPVNAARVSFNKKKMTMSKRDGDLLTYLAEHSHTSPFRHAMLQFEVYEPLMVARQHWKYRIGSAVMEEPDNDVLEAWNESSRRYVTEEPEFYVPTIWRGASSDKKQGSGDPLDTSVGEVFSAQLKAHISRGADLYEQAMQRNVATEMARLFLPAYAMYVRFYWTVSLAGLFHFLTQRLHDDAQEEITEYAMAFWKLAYPHFPRSFNAFGLSLE